MLDVDPLSKIFDGKDVAVIGNSKGLLSSSHGKEIDSLDVVCRMNKAFNVVPPRSNAYSRGIGTRMDVLFVNLVRTSRFKGTGTTVIQTSPCDHDDPKVASRAAFIPTKEMFRGLFDEFQGVKPTTGIRVLFLLKNHCQPKSVHAYGFDWKTKHPSFYGTSDDWTCVDHDFKKEMEYCMNNFFNDETFILHE